MCKREEEKKKSPERERRYGCALSNPWISHFSKSALLYDYCNNNVNLHTFKLTNICDFFT